MKELKWHSLLDLCDILQLPSESQVLPVFCVTDNWSLFDSVYSKKTLADKRLKMDIGILREMLYKKEIKDIRWVESKNQLADCLTKPESSRSVLLKVLNNASDCLNY